MHTTCKPCTHSRSKRAWEQEWATRHTCWLPGHCHALHVLPKSLVGKPSRVRWAILVVKQDVFQSEVVLDSTDENSPALAVECDTFAAVDELDLVRLCNRKATSEIPHGSKANVPYHDVGRENVESPDR